MAGLPFNFCLDSEGYFAGTSGAGVWFAFEMLLMAEVFRLDWDFSISLSFSAICDAPIATEPQT